MSGNFHVYAEDGFESAHATPKAAIAAAARYAKKNKTRTYWAVATSHGYTTGGEPKLAIFKGGKRVPIPGA